MKKSDCVPTNPEHARGTSGLSVHGPCLTNRAVAQSSMSHGASPHFTRNKTGPVTSLWAETLLTPPPTTIDTTWRDESVELVHY